MTKRFNCLAWACFAVSICQAGPASAQTVEVYAAGSLRAVVAALSEQAARSGITLHPSFGGAGALREKIEQGARPDLFLSADMASPSRLAEEGRALVAPVAFARNRLCLVSASGLTITQGNLINTLLTHSVRIKTSRPIVDPASDYAFAMFDRIDRQRPGAGARLRAKAAASWDVSASGSLPGENPTGFLLRSHRIQVAVTYCSAVPDIEKSDPSLHSLAVPARLAPMPVLGLALLSPNPAAALVALSLLSRDGQDMVSKSGLIPLMTAPQTALEGSPHPIDSAHRSEQQ